MDIKTVDIRSVQQVVKGYDTTAEKLDNCILVLESELKEINKEIQKKHTSLHGPKLNTKLRKCVVISVFADVECKVEIVLIYKYDICVNTHTYKEPVTLIYKASITQSTGEDWADSLLTLETITPTFGLNIPKLDVWNLSVYKPTPPTPSIEYKFKSPWTFARSASLPAHTIIPIAHSMHESKVTENSFELEALMYHQGLDVMLSSGKGNVSAMFQVPGLITIPSNGATHNVTIVELSLGAVMSWVCVPKKDMKVHLSAKIKNASQYMLLHGTGSVYVDGSFISAPKCLLSALKKALTVPLGPSPPSLLHTHSELTIIYTQP
ncbi:hypothetical protein H2248_007853 [Termitomyces sp. 'cryptogamus']|nr:hypothetical protein H2248_007853 [Termitomyces sp. 'cryptogamus']